MPDGQRRPGTTVRAVNCPNCGAVTAVRTFGHAVNVVCQSCHSILDAADERVTILQKFKQAIRIEPLVPLGTRGKLPGQLPVYEVVGFQVRQITVDNIDYQWREYLLFNPYYGFRYLTEYAGHWNVVSTLRSLPDRPGLLNRLPRPEGDHIPGNSGTRTCHGRTFRHFQTAVATTTFVLGEFPWQVRVGDEVTAVDYVAPPQMLSAEVTAEKEVTWSLGTYTAGADIWAAFSLPGHPPQPEGVFANQPSPYRGRTGLMLRNAAVLLMLAALVWIAHLVTAREQQEFNQTFAFDPRSIEDSSLVTSVFELDGRPSATRIETATNLDNQWMDVGYALIDEDTGRTYEFSDEVSYYYGVDGGESWTEGSPRSSVTLPSVPPGRYFLRIEPEGDRTGRPVRYTVRVVRDVPTWTWFAIAVVLIAIPPVRTALRAARFEGTRWQESDHPSTAAGSGDDD